MNDFDDIKDFGLDLQEQIKEMSNIQQQHFSDVIDLASKLTEQSKGLYGIDKNRASIQLDLSNIVKEQLSNLQQGNILELKKFSVNKAMKSLNNEMSESQKKATETQLTLLQDTINDNLSLNKQGKTYIESLNEQNDILEQQKEKLTGISQNVTNFTNTLKVMAQNPKIAGGIFMASLAKSSWELASNMFEVRTQLGLSGADSLKLAKNLGTASIKGLAFGVSMKDSNEAAAALFEQFKNINDVTSEAIVQVGKMSSYYGLSAQDGAKLYKTFKEMQPLTNMSAEDSFKMVENMAKIAGVSPGKTMEDVAQNTEYFALYSKDGGKNIADAAITAQQLGMNLSEVSQIASNLLNVESSIESEMQASVLTGKQLNFNKARELALAGDHAGMMKEILNNQFSITEWNEYNMLQRQAIADSLGISVNQMQTMISQQENINKIHSQYGSQMGDTLIKMQKMAKGAWEQKELILSSVNALASMKQLMPGLFKGIGKLVSGVGQWIKGLIKGKAMQSTTNISSGGSEFISGKGKSTKLTSQAARTQKMSNITKKTSTMKGNPLVNWINGWKSLDMKALAKFSLAIGVILVTIPLLALGLKQFNDVDWKSTLQGMTSMLGMVGIMKMIGKMTSGVLKGAFAIGIISTSLLPLGFALKQFNNIDWNTVLQGMTSMLGMIGIMKIIGNKTGSILKGSVALAIMGAALLPLGFALKQFNDIDWNVLSIAGVAILGLTAAIFGLGALLSGPGAIIFGVGVLGFIALGGALTVLGLGLQQVVKPISEFVPLVQELANVSGELMQIGTGFATMGAGLMTFAGSLLAITPMLPVLATVATLTDKLRPIANTETPETNGKKKEDKMDKLINRVDSLITTLEKGGNVYINDRKVGKYLGLKMDRIKVNGI